MRDDEGVRKNVAETVERLTRLGTGISVMKDEGLSIPFARDARGEIKQYEHLLDTPLSIKEHAELKSVDSFIAYAKLHKTDASVLLCDEEARSFGLIVDYHANGDATWKHHRANLALRLTSDMEAWAGANNKQFADQEAFALFLEENSRPIISPSAAEMLQIATEMRAKKDVQFNSKVNIDNGSFHLDYKEETNGTYRDGQTAVPTSFELALIPFRGMTDAYKVEAKLRYKVSQSRLKMWYIIPQLERVFDEAFESTRSRIISEVGLPIFHGTF